MRLSFVSLLDLKMEQASLTKAVDRLCKQIKSTMNMQKRLEREYDSPWPHSKVKVHYKHYDSSTKKIHLCTEVRFRTSKKFKEKMDGLQATLSGLVSERNTLQYQLFKINELIKAREPVVRR